MSFTTPEPDSPPLEPPGAPRYGPKFDDYDAYPRKSARVAQKAQRDQFTPPPPERSNQKKTTVIVSPPTTVKKDRFMSATDLTSPPATGRGASRRKHVTIEDESEDTVMTGMGMGAMSLEGMLPTPAKTPTSKTSTIEPGAIHSVARNLFSYRAATVEDAMPTPRKKGRKSGYGSTSNVEEEPPIQIYTDTKDRIPEVDQSEENPFYGPSKISVPKPTSRTTKRRKTTGARVGAHTYGEGGEYMMHGEGGGGRKGAVFIFRGKKVWRDLEESSGDDDDNEEDVQLEQDLNALQSPRLSVPLNSGNVEGKWLFGDNPKTAREEEEEAATDVEDSKYQHKASSNLKHKSAKTATASKLRAKAPATPKVQGMKVPPTTRVTRAQSGRTGMAAAETPPLRERGRGRGRSSDGDTSPFTDWSRTRSPMETSTSRSRGSNTSPGRKPKPSPARLARQGMTTRSAGEAPSIHL